MNLLAKLIVFALVIVLFGHQHPTTEAQRSLHHWKHDLEHRIRLYRGRRNAIQNILASSIYPARDDIMLVKQNARTTVKISTNGNVRFSDLVIPTGSLKLGPHIVHSTVHILVNKTKSYVESKSNELSHIQSQLDTIRRQLDDPSRHYIYKGQPDIPQLHYNSTNLITGTRVFKRVQYAHLIEATNVTLPKINYTDVTRVIDDTYMRNTKMGSVSDSKGRLYFEGRKTFWNTVFTRSLKSGCCDRLKPLHTSRMMLRSPVQDVLAPILLHSDINPYYLNQAQVAHIGQLSTPVLYNRPVQLNPRPPTRPDDIGLLLPPANLMLQPTANLIRLSDLISTRQFGQPEILKTLVFKDLVVIDEALLSNSFIDNRLVIGLANQPGFAFDLAHDNYLLKFSTLPKNYSNLPVQQVSGTVILEAGAHFLANIQANSVNRIDDFVRFAHETIVRTNRPATIRGPVQFNALPTVFNNRESAQIGGASELRRPHSVLIMRASNGLEVGQVNGMQIPNDIVILPSASAGASINAGAILKPNELIHVRGSRQFANQMICLDHLHVSGLVNGMQMPGGVVPLHLNDFIDTAGTSNLWFMDGLSVHHMTIQGGKFDDINLRDINGDAQSIIMRSMSAPGPDGSLIIRAPLRVTNLNLIQKSGGSGGLLNGFRPQEVLELNARYPYESLYGRKKFAAPVEATECVFSDINNVSNWTNHLIRIDRPNTVQTVHTKLAFNNQYYADANNSIQQLQQQQYPNQSLAQVNVDRLNVEFHPETNQANYQQNWNFSPGFYLLHQAMLRGAANYTGGRYRVLDQVKLISSSGSVGLVNGIALNDIVRLDQPFKFADTFTMVGKVEVKGSLSADRIRSNYPIDAMDLVQFNKYRIPILSSSRAPIKLNSLVLGQGNRASFVQCRLLNGISLSEFIQSIMSLTKPQFIASNLTFSAPINFEAMLSTRSSLNGVKHFNQFAQSIKNAKYIFDDGLQCNAVVIKT